MKLYIVSNPICESEPFLTFDEIDAKDAAGCSESPFHAANAYAWRESVKEQMKDSDPKLEDHLEVYYDDEDEALCFRFLISAIDLTEEQIRKVKAAIETEKKEG